MDAKSYGFIKRDQQAGQIFVHISDFPAGQSKPKIDELVTFEVAESVKGEQAYYVQYVNRAKHVIKPAKITKPKRGKNFSSLIVMVIFGFLVLNLMSPRKSNVIEADVTSFNPLSLSNTQGNVTFQCSGKSQCSEMVSCDEAIYYLKHCPGTIMDGDSDGLPCEDQWCGHSGDK